MKFNDYLIIEKKRKTKKSNWFFGCHSSYLHPIDNTHGDNHHHHHRDDDINNDDGSDSMLDNGDSGDGGGGD